jgi:Caspase domain
MVKVPSQPNKRGLLIGVNKYPNLPAHSQLRGCVNDVQIMKRTLETSFRFPPSNIIILLDEQATAKGIRDAMERLLADCGHDDIVVFHFSGHGSQMAALGEKPRGYDESIMPYDSGRMNPTFPQQVPPCDIRDTDIQEWLSRLTEKTSHVTLIFDSCHSGSITRMQSDSEEHGTRLRWIAPDPLPEGSFTIPESQARGLARDAHGGSGWLPLSEKYVLLAACAAEQGAYEMDHEDIGLASRNGAFTFFLTQELNQATESTYQDIWDLVSIKVNNRFQRQTPQLEGARDRQIFDVQDFIPMRYLLVTERQDDEVQIAGGAIHGVTVGSQWEVYPPGTKEITGSGNTSQGLVQITRVEPVTAKAKIVNESAHRAIGESGRAVEAMHVDEEMRMAVWLKPAPSNYQKPFEELRKAVAQSRLLKVSESSAGARALITITFQTDTDKTGNTRTIPMWDVLDQSQARMVCPRPLTDADAKLRITENLETVWRYLKVLELRNEKSVLKGKVDLVLLKKEANGQWHEAAGVEPVYKEGDAIAFRVINRSGVPLHVSVLDLGLSKRISLLYPPASASETLAAGRAGGGATEVEASGTLSVGEKSESEIELFFPQNLTSIPSGKESTRGKEIFKLCVTTQRHDLAFLRQGGLRTESSQPPLHPLEGLLYFAAGRGSAREARVKLTPQDEWFTIERSFWLERNPTSGK